MLHYLQHKIYLEFLKIWTIDKSELPRGSISRHMEVRIYSTFLWQKDQRRLFSTVKSIGHLSLLHQLLKILISDLTRPLASEKLGSQHRQQPPVAWILIGYCFRISPSFFFFSPRACSMREFLGQGWNPPHSRDLSHSTAWQHRILNPLYIYTHILAYAIHVFSELTKISKSEEAFFLWFGISLIFSSGQCLTTKLFLGRITRYTILAMQKNQVLPAAQRDSCRDEQLCQILTFLKY